MMKKIFFVSHILLLFQFISIASAYSICYQGGKIKIHVMLPFKYNRPVGYNKAEEVTNCFCKQLEAFNFDVETINEIDIGKKLVGLNIRSSVYDLTVQEMVNLGIHLKSDFIIRGLISKLDSLLILTVWVIKVDSAYKQVFTVKSINADFKAFQKYKIREISKSIKEYILKQK